MRMTVGKYNTMSAGGSDAASYPPVLLIRQSSPPASPTACLYQWHFLQSWTPYSPLSTLSPERKKKTQDGVRWDKKNTNKAFLSWAGTSLREFILVEKWGVLSMRSSVSSRRSSTTVTSSLWNLIHSSLMADSRSGMLTRRWNERDKMRNNEVVRSWEQNAIERVTNRESHLVFEVLFLQVLYIRDHFMDDWIQHGLEK